MGQAADGSEEIRINSHARFGEFFAGFLFAAVWWTAIWAMVRFNVPIAVPIFMGLFGALLVIGLIDSLIGGSIIRVRRDVVVVKRHWFGVPIFSRTIDATTIESVVANPAPNAKWYQVEAVRHGTALKASIAGAIRDRRDAEMLAARIARTVLPQQPKLDAELT